MSVDVTVRFENDDDADIFLRGVEHGYVDGRRLIELKSEISVVGEEAVPGPSKAVGTLSYHDLYITTKEIKRTRLFDMGYGYELSCNRVGGWTLWDRQRKVAGEYDGRGLGLRLDVDGHVIVDSLTPRKKLR